jgi:prepilin-type N-terminal cleavage/methylation domain-containing protein
VQLKRRGFTLTELLVSIAIASVLMAAVTVTLSRQQRFYSRIGEVLEVKSGLRDAADVLASDIRGAAVAGYGVPLTSDSALELYSTIGSSIACTAASPVFGLPPALLVNGNTLTSFVAPPDTGDLVELYTAPSANLDSAKWETRRIASFQNRSITTACPSSTGFTTTSDASSGVSAYQLVITGSPVVGARKGALVRFVRRARYSIYKSSDNLWYLGYRRCGVVAPYTCSTIQPVSGPYRPYSAAGQSGLSFRFYDTSGAELLPGATGFALARVDIVIRGQSSRNVGLAGDVIKPFRDSVVVTVSPRNRSR